MSCPRDGVTCDQLNVGHTGISDADERGERLRAGGGPSRDAHPRERELFQLVAEDTPQSEIAEIMGYANADSVKVTLNRIRKKIKDGADEAGGGISTDELPGASHSPDAGPDGCRPKERPSSRKKSRRIVGPAS